jgi:hypothetical protein
LQRSDCTFTYDETGFSRTTEAEVAV